MYVYMYVLERAIYVCMVYAHMCLRTQQRPNEDIGYPTLLPSTYSFETGFLTELETVVVTNKPQFIPILVSLPISHTRIADTSVP